MPEGVICQVDKMSRFFKAQAHTYQAFFSREASTSLAYLGPSLMRAVEKPRQSSPSLETHQTIAVWAPKNLHCSGFQGICSAL